ncbi:hypothetical protein TP2_01065 [Thioclava pacifica DSM 10166]|uniref:Uncharacterized protein n=1 Tax=Thioclava pacifica DSM 10166 TaxID=1353537 RepID=A0A074JKP1_9RHOB|nr:hypothetical protein TP2_01065 [Thioclava pacifica DSM 10166]
MAAGAGVGGAAEGHMQRRFRPWRRRATRQNAKGALPPACGLPRDIFIKKKPGAHDFVIRSE